MLQSLSINNYAIIDKVQMDFVHGFNIITGETGAGKSILLGALNLILGGRADTKILYNSEDKCIVEATFETNSSSIQIDEDLDIDIEDGILLRREINRKGKSRAFVNGTMCTLTELRSISTQLVDIHNQFDTLSIVAEDHQLEVIDLLAKNESIQKSYSKSFVSYSALQAELKKLKNAKSKSAQDLDYINFQLAELNKVDLDNLNKEELEQEFQTLNSAEDIKIVLAQLASELVDSEHSIESRLIELLKSSNTHANANKKLGQISETLDESLEAVRLVQELAEEVNDELDSFPGRVEELRDLLDHVYLLEKKHKVDGISELIALRDKYQLQTAGNEDIESLIFQKENELKERETKLRSHANQLSESRRKAIYPLVKQIEKMLIDLAMPNAVVQIEQNKLDTYTDHGNDHISIQFSSNKGVAPQPLAKVASGGELSRFALSIRSIIAKHMGISTLIFDEIDTGISGAVAVRTGQILSELSLDRQVICITHSPQIAAMAQKHFFVNKKDSAKRTTTNVDVLSTELRIMEIAKMLSNDPPSQAAIQNARELLEV